MSGKRILIVDDEAPMRLLLSKQLQRAGFETVTAADGAAALAATTAGSFDAIVLDVVMPGMDGFEVCRQLKSDPRTAGIAVLFLSASCSGEFRRRAFSVGAADFLAKPFQTEELPAYIQAILRHPDSPAPARGHVVSVIGADRLAGAASVATRLAETAALQGPGPTMLIDLELPAGSIGARLQLSGGPNMGGLLQKTGDPITDDAIARVAQRYHGAMEVMPAPFSPTMFNQSAPDSERLDAILDNLVGRGYFVVLHLGTRVDPLNLSALQRSETIWIAATEDGQSGIESLQGEMTAAGIRPELIIPTQGMPATILSALDTALIGRSRGRKKSRTLEPATGRLAVVA